MSLVSHEKRSVSLMTSGLQLYIHAENRHSFPGPVKEWGRCKKLQLVMAHATAECT